MRPSILRRSLALAGAALIISTTAVFADQINPLDGDTAVNPSNISYKSAPNDTQRNCDDRGEAVPGSLTLKWNGSAHFDTGQNLTLSATTPTGVSVSFTGGTSYALGIWTSANHTDRVIAFSTTVATTASAGTVTIRISGSGYTESGQNQTVIVGGYAIDNSFNVSIDCPAPPANTAPDVAADNATVTVTEGTTAQNTGTVSDDDGDAVALSASIGSVVDNSDGTWSWSFGTTDGPAQSQTVTITADDGTDTSTATFALVVNNANPVVATPSFSNSSINCGSSVNLTGISFSDAGVDDDPWAVNIDWGDGSTDTNYNTNTQGSQASQSHTFSTPGTFTATVGVTDKDGGYGSNTSSNTVTVNQYAVTFLAPFDGSSPSNLITNTMKSGRVVPVKAVIYDYCSGTYVTDPAAVVTIVVKATTIGSLADNDAVEVYADAGAANSNTLQFRWSSDSTAPGGGFWIYNLDSKTAIGGSAMVVNTSYRVDIFVGSARATGTTWALLKPVK